MFCKTVILVLLVSVASCAALQLDGCASDRYRLPKNLVPTHYDLTVDVDLEKDTFGGEVDIHVKVLSQNEQLAQNQIALHASNKLSIDKIEYTDVASGAKIEVGDVCRNKNDVVIISLAQDLVVGSEGLLHISFEGEYGKEEAGFYKSREITSTRDRYVIAVTHFAPVNARDAFPCFDEPALKATFNVTIIHDEDQTALSNNEQISREIVQGSDGQKRVRSAFNTTPVMSTYLVAYIVGQFEYIEEVILDGRVTMRFYTPAGRTEEARFALDIGTKALPLLEDYFGIQFPMKKIDFVSIREYAGGAMENWGLITGLEITMLDYRDNFQYSQTIAAQTTVHELAHQWFGNLVTLQWWNDLWLNEGFAKWVEYNMTAVLMPEVNFDAVFSDRAINHIYKTDHDQQETAVAIREENENISTDIIDLIVYDKGSAIIKNLVQEYLHPDNFRSALRHYMKTHAYGNAKSEDLWHSMELYSKEPVAQFMESWLYQDGHPILTVDVKKDFLSIKQSVFTHDKAHLVGAEKKWIIPVNIIVSDSESRRELIDVTLTGELEEELVTLPDWFNPKISTHWLKVNCNGTGLYNVEYSAELLANLRVPIERKLLDVVDRIDLLINYAALVEAKQYQLPVEFDKFIKWYKKEDQYPVMKLMLESINALTSSHKQSANLFFEVFGDFLEQNGYHMKPEPNSYDEEIRLSILDKALRKEHKPTIKSMFNMLDESKSLDEIKGQLNSNLFDTVLNQGSAEHRKQLRAMVNNMENSSRKQYNLDTVDEAIKMKDSSKIKKLFGMFKS